MKIQIRIKYWGELRLCYPLEFTNLLKHIGIGKHGLYQLRVMHGSGGQHQQGGCAVSLAQHGTERPKGCANNPLKPWKLTKAHGRFWKVMKAHKSFWKLLDSSWKFDTVVEAYRTIRNPLEAIGNTKLKWCDRHRERHRERHRDTQTHVLSCAMRN